MYALLSPAVRGMSSVILRDKAKAEQYCRKNQNILLILPKDLL